MASRGDRIRGSRRQRVQAPLDPPVSEADSLALPLSQESCLGPEPAGTRRGRHATGFFEVELVQKFTPFLVLLVRGTGEAQRTAFDVDHLRLHFALEGFDSSFSACA